MFLLPLLALDPDPSNVTYTGLDCSPIRPAKTTKNHASTSIIYLFSHHHIHHHHHHQPSIHQSIHPGIHHHISSIITLSSSSFKSKRNLTHSTPHPHHPSLMLCRFRDRSLSLFRFPLFHHPHLVHHPCPCPCIPPFPLPSGPYIPKISLPKTKIKIPVSCTSHVVWLVSMSHLLSLVDVVLLPVGTRKGMNKMKKKNVLLIFPDFIAVRSWRPLAFVEHKFMEGIDVRVHYTTLLENHLSGKVDYIS